MFSILGGITQQQQIIISALCASIVLLTLLNGILVISLRRKNKKVNKMLHAENKNEESFNKTPENDENSAIDGGKHNI